MNGLEERGVFWWHEEIIPKGYLAPDSHISGLLTIDENGQATLELDSTLPSDKHFLDRFADHENAALQGRRIEGLLKVSNKRVLLLELRRHGGQYSSNGITYEGFAARFCLVSTYRPPSATQAIRAKEMTIELAGFEEWLRLGAITSKRTKTTISVRYRKPKDLRYRIHDGVLDIRHYVSGPIRGIWRDEQIALKEIVVMRFRPETPQSLADVQKTYGYLQELFVLLTDSEFTLAWPRVKLRSGRSEREYEMYFWRTKSKDAAPHHAKCPTNFLRLRESFGKVVAAWQLKREQYGPGFYLYLGVRRGMKFYAEHRFVNLLWGMEALHRRKASDETPGETKNQGARRTDTQWNHLRQGKAMAEGASQARA
jgi:hypothetical protein